MTSTLESIYTDLSDWLYGEYISAVEYELERLARNKAQDIMELAAVRGLYVLFRNGEVVYVGKASGVDTNVRGRFQNHCRKIEDSIIPLSQMTAKVIKVHKRHLILTLEEMLIQQLAPPWNGMDFGGNKCAVDSTVRKTPSKWQLTYGKEHQVGV